MRVKSLTLLLTGILLLSAIISTIGSEEPTDLKHLIKDDIAEPSTLDAAWAHDKPSCELLWNVYETLIRFKANYTDQFDPLLADTWHYTAIDEYSPEGIHWVGRMYFHPRTDVSIYFHDAPENGPGGIPGEGDQLTLADIEYSFERFLITDHSDGPAWKLHWPLHNGYSMLDLNATLSAIREGTVDAAGNNATHSWIVDSDRIGDGVDKWVGAEIEFLNGTHAGTVRPIVAFNSIRGNITFSGTPFTADVYDKYDIGWPINPLTGWNTRCDEAIDHAVEVGKGHVWFNLVFPIPDILCQVIAMPWCGILSKTWCTQHLVGDFPGIEVGDVWAFYHDPPISPIDAQVTGSPGPNLDAALGTGPYQFDYWNKGAGGLWSVRANNEALGNAVPGKEYWRHWLISPQKPDYVDRFSSYFIPEWATRKLRFLACISDITHVPTACIDEIRVSKTGGLPEENFEQYLPGIRCDWGTWNGTHFTPYLALKLEDTICFNLLVSITSTHLGVMQPPGVFNELGAPPNFFNDTYTRLAFTHMFSYAEYSELAYHNESIAPATPIIRGLSPSPPVGWPADAKVGNMTLAVGYLKVAWGGTYIDLNGNGRWDPGEPILTTGALWNNGFTMDFVYNEGNVEREIACILLRDALNKINADYGTKFHGNVVSVPWSVYKLELRARKLPFFFVDWEANLPDAHFAAYNFMHSEGIANLQGYVGVTEFPNEEVDEHVEAAINTTVFAERLGNYTWLRNYYKENAPGSPLAQPIKRHWRKVWVRGWVFNPLTDGMHYAYDLWKQLIAPPPEIDLEAIDIRVRYHFVIVLGSSPTIMKPTVPINITVQRLDIVGPWISVIVALCRTNSTGYKVVIDTKIIAMGPGWTETVSFLWNETDLPDCQDPYLISGEVWQINGNDPNPANNIIYDTEEVTVVDADFDDDGDVDYDDITYFIPAYIVFWSGGGKDPKCDLDKDCDIDYEDIVLFVTAYITYWTDP